MVCSVHVPLMLAFVVGGIFKTGDGQCGDQHCAPARAYE
jgi:hypothetical protein